jgi:hypothetical protein
MKRLLLIFILTFSFQSWTKANDIRDFQIEGMSIGDSLLDFYSKAEIEKARIEFTSQNKKYSYSEISDNFENFESLQFIYKKDDNKYIIAAIVGIIFYDNELDNCLAKKETMIKDVKSVIPVDTDIYSDDGYPHSQKFSKSLVYTTEFGFKNGDQLRIYCLNWSKSSESNNGWTDHLSLNIQTQKFMHWLNNEAYK